MGNFPKRRVGERTGRWQRAVSGAAPLRPLLDDVVGRALGAVAAFLALAIAGLSSQNHQAARAAYVAMDLIGWFVIVPCSLAALLTGLGLYGLASLGCALAPTWHAR